MSEIEADVTDVMDITLRHEMWRRGDLSYKLDSLQLKIKETNQDAEESLVLSSRQIGKSFGELCEAIEDCIKHPGIIVRFATDTFDHMQEIVEDNMIPICADAPPGMVKQLKASGRWRIGKSSLRLGALERQYVDKNRGGNAFKIILEEGGFVKSEDYKYAVESIFSAQLLRSGGKLKHVSTVSEDEDHYLHTEILPKCELMKTVSSYTVFDSPSITEEQIAKAAARCGGMNTPAWRREYLAIIERNLEKVIIPKFDKTKHLVPDWVRPTHLHWVLGWDLGATRDLDAAVFICYDYARAKVRAVKGLVWEPNTNTDIIEADLKRTEEELGISKWDEVYNPTTMKMEITYTKIQEIARYGDGPHKVLNDLSEKRKYHIIMPEKTNQPGAVNALDIAFYNDEIEIDPVGCPHLVTTLSNGKFNKQRTDFERTKALGHFDSGMALVYAYRHVNKKNPFPAEAINRDLQMRIRPSKDISDAEALAKSLSRTRPRMHFKR